jgi:hypothetical protein
MRGFKTFVGGCGAFHSVVMMEDGDEGDMSWFSTTVKAEAVLCTDDSGRILAMSIVGPD